MPKKKKPKHSRLVVPEIDEIALPKEPAQPDRLGRIVPQGKVKPSPAADAPAATQPPPVATPEEREAPGPVPEEEDEALPPNAVVMPTTKRGKREAIRKNPKIAAIRRKKLRRKLIPVVFLAILAALGFVYLSGIYLPALTWASETITDIRISAKPGDGFPMALTLNEFIEADEMGSLGAAVLGAKDLLVISSTGSELQRIQHGYVNPSITTGTKRVCVYGRGSKEYTLLGRDKVLAKRNLGEEILFAEMSPGGYLAMVTLSRYQATLQVFSPVFGENEPILRWPFLTAEELPVCLAFHGDDRSFAVATVATRDGVLGTNLYLTETGRDTVKATVWADDAFPLHVEYLSAGRVLVVYDSFAAVYSTTGEEVYRYAFGSRSLATMDCAGGLTALVFGSAAQEAVSLVILDERLAPLAQIEALSVTTPRVMVSGSGVLLLCDDELTAYSRQGSLAGTLGFAERPAALLWSGEELALTREGLIPLASLFAPEEGADPAA